MDDIFFEKINYIPTSDSKDLAAHIVLFRAHGMGKEFAKLCMCELCKRRDAGDSFNYEDFIETELAKITKPAAINIKSVISNMGSLISNIK